MQSRPNGAAVAAMLSTAIGLLAMTIANFLQDAWGKPVADTLINIGKLWIPNAPGLGPYSGKETLLFLGWFFSWLLLHFTLRKRQIDLRIPTILFVIGIAISTLLVYTPFIDFLLGK